MPKKLFPAMDWMANYHKEDLRGDLSAGIIVAVMLIPQGMAYAMLAGLPPVIGLYASTVPLIVYALFGTSRQLAVGPVAMVSLLVLSGVSTLAEPGSAEYISLVLLLMFMIGLIQFLLGLLRLGFLVNFLSHAVVSGFTTAAAIIIGFSQLKGLLGIDINSENVFLMIGEVFSKIPDIHLWTFFIGIGSILLLVALKKFVPKVPGPLVVVGLSILTVSFFHLDDYGVKIVGEVPKGLPTLSLPAFDLDSVMALFPIALAISFIGFMESIAMAKAIAVKEKYKVDANRELIGLGLANAAGSFFSAYPVTGGFSRSAVNYQAGARTPLASIITAVLIILTLMFFTGLFHYLPNAVLAAIIMTAVHGLIDVKEAVNLFKIRSADGWTWVITFLATLAIGIEQGILTGLAFSLLVFIGRSAYPHVAELGYLPEKNAFRNIRRFPEAKVDPEVLIFRIDSPLYFANMAFFENKLCEKIGRKPQVKWVILDFSGVTSIDAVAIHSLEEIMASCGKGGIGFRIAGIKGPVMDLLKKAEWDKKFGGHIQYFSIEQALKSIGTGDESRGTHRAAGEK